MVYYWYSHIRILPILELELGNPFLANQYICERYFQGDSPILYKYISTRIHVQNKDQPFRLSCTLDSATTRNCSRTNSSLHQSWHMVKFDGVYKFPWRRDNPQSNDRSSYHGFSLMTMGPWVPWHPMTQLDPGTHSLKCSRWTWWNILRFTAPFATHMINDCWCWEDCTTK